MNRYTPKDIENKWIEKWSIDQLYKTKQTEGKDKFYSLYSFPYPSGDGLHVGHAEGMVANDIAARFNRMKGKNVLIPMGWDSFGLPAENFAIKTGVPPQESTENAIKNFIEQIKRLGISVDWDLELGAHRPDYYKWTQWIFLQMYKKGIAYKKNAPVNWCPKDQTVLANEQVIDGRCERCDSLVEKKDMNQWFFKITNYAERLVNDLDKVDWPESTKAVQRHWIGQSEGTNVKFQISNSKSQIEIFTTRIDTIFGCTFLVVAPEHVMLQQAQHDIENWNEVSEYIDSAKNKTDLERQSQKEKSGVEVKGIKAINPFNNEEIPVYVADYVLNTYGTGAIMAVPAHDERDGEFALKYDIEIKQVIKPGSEEYISYVARQWSNDFDKFLTKIEELNPTFVKKTVDEVIFKFDAKFTDKYIEIAAESVLGKRAWHDAVSENEALVIFGTDDGDVTPGVDIVHIPKFMTDPRVWTKMTVFEAGVRPFKNLWHMLSNSDYKTKVLNTDTGILVNSGEFSNLSTEEATTKMQAWLEEKGLGFKKTTFRLRDWLLSRQRYWGCPIPVVYDPEGNPHPMEEKDLPLLLPTDVDFKPTGESPIKSSESFKKLAEEKYGKGWYFEADTMDTFVDSSWYFLRYMDHGNEQEVFTKENVNYWNPADLYMIGAEHTVLHLMYARFFTKFLFDEGYINFDEPFAKLRHMGIISGPDGRKMSKRWGNVINPNDEVDKYSADTVRMYEMFMGPLEEPKPWNDSSESGVFRFLSRVWDLSDKVSSEVESPKQEAEINKLIGKIEKDTASLAFNTAVAKFMEFVNFAAKENSLSKSVFETFLKLLAPYAPFITEELWSKLGNNESIHLQSWPVVDESKFLNEDVNLAVQFNGKSRGLVSVSADANEEDIMNLVKADDKLAKYITGEPKKVIYVKGKIINIVV